jgi:hypothetical protein
VHEEQRRKELRKNIKQVMMGANEAAAYTDDFWLLIPRPRDASSAKLTKR